MAQATEYTFQTRTNKTLAAKYWRQPNQSTPPRRVAISLHGWLDNASTFDLIAPLITTGTQNGGFDILVALDLAGHGLSEHNQTGIYHPNEHVADLVDVLLNLEWFLDGTEDFTCKKDLEIYIIGHSMGGGIAAIFCGTFPTQIQGLIMIEAIGPWSGNNNTAAIDLHKSICTSRNRRIGKNKRPPRVFVDQESAALRRSQGNAVGKLPIEACRILCRRGLKTLPVPMLSGNKKYIENNASKTTDSLSGFVWSTDPALLGPSRIKLSPGQARSFCANLKCNTMILTVNDGIMRRSTNWFGGGTLWGKGVGMLIHVLLYAVRLVQYCRSWFIAIPNKTIVSLLYGLNYGLGLRERLKIMKAATPTFIHGVMETGGHHPQLTEPVKVAYHLLEFLRTVS